MTARMILPQWDEYRSAESYGSDRWATSDRGWCFDLNSPEIEHTCIGNYLRYSEDRGPNGETVHACAYHMETGPLTSTYHTYRHGSGWFHTIEDAKEYIINAVQGYFQAAA